MNIKRVDNTKIFIVGLNGSDWKFFRDALITQLSMATTQKEFENFMRAIHFSISTSEEELAAKRRALGFPEL